MKHKLIITGQFVLLLFVIFYFSNTNTVQKQQINIEVPSLDLSTPENTIYSYIKIQKCYNDIYYKKYIDERDTFYNSLGPMMPIFTNRINEIFNINNSITVNKSEYEYSIKEMKQETNTRVICMLNVKNVTPVPPNVTVDEFTSDKRKNGENYKIVLENNNSKWLISDVESSLYTGAELKSIIQAIKPSAECHVRLINP